MAEVYACECGSRVFVEVRLVTLDAAYEIPASPLSGYVRHASVAHLCVACRERAGAGMEVVTVPDSEDSFFGVLVE